MKTNRKLEKALTFISFSFITAALASCLCLVITLITKAAGLM